MSQKEAQRELERALARYKAESAKLAKLEAERDALELELRPTSNTRH